MVVRTEITEQWYVKPGSIKYMPVLRPIEISLTLSDELPTTTNFEVAEYQEFEYVTRQVISNHCFLSDGFYSITEIHIVDRYEDYTVKFAKQYDFINRIKDLETYDNKYKEEG